MPNVKYLMYIDILGFEALAWEIASKKGIDVRDVRTKLIDTIKERMVNLEMKKIIIGKKYGDSDDWVLILDPIDNIFLCVLNILDHNTGYIGFEKVPLEIAIGNGKYDKWAKYDGINLIIESSTIDFLKTNIINSYKRGYKEKTSHSIKSTFVIITESLYNEFEGMDKCLWNKKIDTRDPTIMFYEADIEKFISHARIIEFIKKLQTEAKIYKNIEALYVKPKNFFDIKTLLEKYNIVFIIGDPEIGKTYTAIKLLFDLYKEGYDPIWVRNKEEQSKIICEKSGLDGKAIYLEDPWGRTKFEPIEETFREIGNLVRDAKECNIKIIISCRTKIFEEFYKNKETAEDLMNYKQELRVNLAYDAADLLEILKRYIRVFEPEWAGNSDLEGIAFSAAGSILKTPMSIKQFINLYVFSSP